MARIGFQKAKTRSAANRPDAIKNKEGGTVFAFQNPIEKLIGMIGSYMGEPGFYPDAPETPSDRYNQGVLDEKGRTILNAAIEVATSNSPEDLLRIAAWARQKLNMRLVPQILLAAGARYIRVSMNGPRNLVARYVPVICQRPDDALQAFAVYCALFGSKRPNQTYVGVSKLPNGFKKGLAVAISRYSDYAMLKYNKEGQRPGWQDLLAMLKGVKVPSRFKKPEGFPLKQGMFEYIVNGKTTEDAPKIVRARKQFFGLEKTAPINDELMELIRTAGLTWENLVSHLGQKAQEPKNSIARQLGLVEKMSNRQKEVWTAAAQIMPYMASLRNLRNLAQAGVDLGPVLSKLTNREAVLKSRQLPFRYLSAYKSLNISEGDPFALTQAREAMSEALDISIENLADLPGRTAVFSDNSGSMSTPVSRKGTVKCVEIANLLGALIYKKTENAIAAPFGASVSVPKLLKKDSALTLYEKISREGTRVGHSTAVNLCLDYLTKNKIKVDRVIFLTDLQTWGDRMGGYGYGYGMGNVADALTRYRRSVNSDVYYHSVNLAASGFSMVPTNDPRVNCISGFSEKILGIIADFEIGKAEKVDLPTLDSIRREFSVEGL